MAYITSGTRHQQRNRLWRDLSEFGTSPEAFLALGELVLETDEARAEQIADLGRAVGAIALDVRAVRAENIELRRQLEDLRRRMQTAARR